MTRNDEILKRAVEIYCIRAAAALPTESELAKVTFSEGFKDKLYKRYKCSESAFYFMFSTAGRRVASIIIMILMLSSSIVFGVKSIREPVINFIVETYNKFSTVLFDKDYNQEKHIIEKECIPTYIPEGYVVRDKLINQDSVWITYVNDNGNIIEFRQININGSNYYLDTEDVNVQKIKINNTFGVYYSNKDFEKINWYDRYSFSLEAYGLDKNELLKIAESVE